MPVRALRAYIHIYACDGNETCMHTFSRKTWRRRASPIIVCRARTISSALYRVYVPYLAPHGDTPQYLGSKRCRA